MNRQGPRGERRAEIARLGSNGLDLSGADQRPGHGQAGSQVHHAPLKARGSGLGQGLAMKGEPQRGG